MGCWNKTCGITNLPIFYEDEMIMFVIIESPVKNVAAPCHATSFWNYIPLPIYGKYNDYGWIDENKGQEYKLKLLTDIFGKDIIRIDTKNEDGSHNRYPEVKDDPFESFNILGESIHGSIFALHDKVFQYNKECLISTFSVNKKTFDELSATFHNEWQPNNGVAKADLISAIQRYTQFKAAKFAAVDNNDTALQRMLIRLDNSGGLIDEFIESEETIEHPWLSPYYSILNFWFGRTSSGSEIGWLTSRFIREIQFNEVELSATEMVDSYMMFVIVDQLRKQFYPPGHEGSQSDISDIHTQFVKTFQNRIDDRKSMFDDE